MTDREMIETLACRVARLELILAAFSIEGDRPEQVKVRELLADIRRDLEDHLKWAEHFKSSR